ncbi:MAG: DUF971 domain-containing protein [Acidimicrobiia bacterium]|nr:DUF971 domain-containing protein [Acidimicrobiia bacterium]
MQTIALSYRGAQTQVPAAWLRLHCPCEECALIDIGERRVLVAGPSDWDLASVEQGQENTVVTWRSGHVSTYPADFVQLMQRKANRRRWEPQLWDTSHVVAEVRHDDLMSDAEVRRRALLDYRAHGLLVVRGVPTSGVPTEDFFDALRIPIWEGPFGLRSIDTRVQAVAYNVAETAEALPPHTDLAGYEWPPSGQMLHLLVNDTTGGESIAVDGWQALHSLRTDEPEMFDVLVDVPVAHRLFSENRETFARAPLVRLDTEGAVSGFRFSNQTIQPLPLDEPRLAEWHLAYAELTRRLLDPQQAVSFKLEEGDAYLTHAHRVLHGRTAFATGGDRCIRDVYFEFDNVLALVDQLTGELF